MSNCEPRAASQELNCIKGDEVLHLPGVVDQAEGSPGAASEAARVIRKFLGLSNANPQRAYVQYNAVMLTRILADNPGKTFTRNIDGRFVTTVNKLLKDGKDMSVQQILRETLDNFQTSKSEDETLKPLLTMWQDYKAKMAKRGGFNPAIVSLRIDMLYHRAESYRVLCNLELQRKVHSPSTIHMLTDTITANPGTNYHHLTNSPPVSKKPRHPPSSYYRSCNPHHQKRSSTTTYSKNSFRAANPHLAPYKATLIVTTQRPTRIHYLHSSKPTISYLPHYPDTSVPYYKPGRWLHSSR